MKICIVFVSGKQPYYWSSGGKSFLKLSEVSFIHKPYSSLLIPPPLYVASQPIRLFILSGR